MSTPNFQHALERLVLNAQYREMISKDGQRLKDDFQLSDDEMDLMVKVAQQTGWLKGIQPMAAGPCCCCCCCPN